jgi:uncharacterized protein (TIGR02246 family)
VTLSISAEDRAAFLDVIALLEDAWNAGDGDAFATPFAEDADFVNIYGLHGKGRPSIAAAHSQILRTVYAGSTLKVQLRQAQMIRQDVALLHLRSTMLVPSGPLAGEMNATPSVVLERAGARWQIVAFHNTLVQTPPAMHNNGRPADGVEANY